MTQPETKALALSVGDATNLATRLVKSNLLPDKLRGREADILFTILAGAELGMGPMAAIRGMHVVDGKPTLAADTMVGLALASGRCEYFILVEGNERVATYETKRRGSPEPQRMSFTIAEAQKARLTGKDVWQKYPASMLRARAKAALARDVYPDLLSGVYDPDELGSERVHLDVDVGPDHASGTVIDVEPEQPDADLVKRLETSIAIAKGEGTQALEALMSELRPLPEGPAKDGLRQLYKEAHREAVKARMLAPPSSTAESAEPQPCPSPAPSDPVSTSGPTTAPTGPRPTGLHSDDEPKTSGRRRRVSPPHTEPAAAAPTLPLGNPPGVPQFTREQEEEFRELELTAKELHDNPAWLDAFEERVAKLPESRRRDRLSDVAIEVRHGISAEQAAADAAAEQP